MVLVHTDVATEAEALLFGFRRRMSSARRALVRIGTAVLAVGAVLYLVMAYPDDTRRGNETLTTRMLGIRKMRTLAGSTR